MDKLKMDKFIHIINYFSSAGYNNHKKNISVLEELSQTQWILVNSNLKPSPSSSSTSFFIKSDPSLTDLSRSFSS